MILNKTLSCLKKSYSKLPKLHSYKTSACNAALKTKTISLKHHRVLPNHLSFCFYSSAANEEKIKVKQSAPAITIPPLVFEDVSIEKAVSHEELCKALQACNSLEEQMHTLTSTMALSSEDFKKRVNFCRVIESLLRPFFGEIKIQMFGSSANGFGFKGCDLDLSFETFAEQKKEVSYLDPPDVPLVSEVLCGKVSPLEISLLPPKEQLLFIHTVLLEFYKESEEPPIFINAHVPLIRFYHDKYGLKCDLTCRNRVAFANTKLLYLFGRLDERVIPLMMTLRYWAKHVELIGKGLYFNTYTISLMVIHFLQTRDPPILPSAQHILSLSDSLQIEDMSDKSFLSIRKLIPPSENTQTLSELLKEFFFYYLFFDFTRVICPLIGGSVPRDVFFNESTSRKFHMNSICVQDPMCVSHNVAELVDYKVCKNFFAELITSCRIFQDNSALVPSLSKWGLWTVLDKPDDVLSNKKFPTTVSLTVPLITKQIFSECANDNIHLSTAETLLQLLRYTLLFECNVAKPDEVVKMLKQHDVEIAKKRKYVEQLNYSYSELQKYKNYKGRIKSAKIDENKYSVALMVEDFQNLNLNNKLVLCAECKATKNTWLGRCHVSLEQLPPNSENSLIEKEHYISINAAKQNSINVMDEKMKPFSFLLECYTSPELPHSHLLVNFRPLKTIYFNPILGVFLKEYLSNLIKSINKDC